MKEEAVADFVGRFARNPEGGVQGEPQSCRAVMSKKRLVVAGDGDERITVPLSRVVDVVVGNVPPNLRDLFDATVTVGYKTDEGTVETVLIEGDDSTMSKFQTVLFKCLLNGTKALVKHPAQLGGRVTDSPVRKAKISIESKQVRFKTSGDNFTIDITNVIDFERTERAPDGESRPTLVVKHADDGQVATSLVSPASSRKLNLLGRYFRIEYSELLNEVGQIDLSESEKRVLVTIYATGGDIDFKNVLDGSAAQATNVVNSLREKGLIEEEPTGLSLTSHGQVVVSQRLEDVNI